MNILHLSLQTNLEKHDAPYTHTLSIANELIKNKNKVHLLIGGNKHEKSIIDGIKLEVINFKPYVNVNVFMKKLFILALNNIIILINALKYKNLDIIYERFGTGLIAGLILSKFKNIPIIYEVNGIMDEELFIILKLKNNFIKKVVSKLMRLQLNNANGIIVQTEELKEIIGSKCSNANIYVVNNGVELMHKNIRKNERSITKITYVGTIDELHNLDIIFQVLNSSKQRFIFNIVGGGSQLEHYKNHYVKEKRFIFHDNKDHRKALKLIETSSICIASYADNYRLFKKYGFYLCPLKLLEYSAAGIPTIMYGLSNSFTKTLEEGNACIVVNSKEEFIQKLRFLIKNKKFVKKMGLDAKEIAKKFSWKKSAKKTEEILKYAINTN